MKKFAILFVAMLILVGCGGSDEKTTTAAGGNANTEAATNAAAPVASNDAYVFQSGDVAIAMNAEAAPILEKLGKEDSYFQSESCAFKGLDKEYTYGSFILKTYPMDDKDYVSSIEIKDDLISTPEGISIGSSAADVAKAYGEPATAGNYSYTKGDSTLMFVVKDDAVTSIQYTAITE